MSIGKTSKKSSTTAPLDPAVTSAYGNLLNKAQAVTNQPLQLYGGQLVAPLNQTQNTAIQNIQQAGGISAPYLTEAANYANAGANTFTPAPFSQAAIDQYNSPYQKNVIDATMALENQQDAEAQQSLAGNITAAGAWGGDRSAVLQAQLARQQALANNATNAGLENQGYTQALGQFNTTNQTGLQANQANNANNQAVGYELGSLGTGAENTALNAGQALFGAGTAEQNVAQEQLNVPYEQYLQTQAYPYQNLQFLASLLPGIAQGTGTQTTGSNTQPFNWGSLIGLGSPYAKGGRTHLATGGAGFGLYSPMTWTGGVPEVASYVPTASAPAVSPQGGGGEDAGGAGGHAYSGKSSGLIGDADNPGALEKIGGLADMAGSALSFLKRGGLADGGNDDGDVDTLLDSLYPGPAVPPPPSGASAMSLGATPPEWRGLATNYADTPPDDATAAPAAPPATWDDGTPVAPDVPPPAAQSLASPSTAGKVIWQNPNKPDLGHSILTGLAGFLSTGNIGKGIGAGLKDYDEQKDPHPEVDHSGSSVMIRYGAPGQNAQLIDTGIPTEAALNSRAAAAYRAANLDVTRDTREDAIQQRREAAAEAAEQRRQAAADRAAAAAEALDWRKQFQQQEIDIRQALADKNNYSGLVPGKGVDDKGNLVDGIYTLDKTSGQPVFTPGGTLTQRASAKSANAMTWPTAVAQARKDYDNYARQDATNRGLAPGTPGTVYNLDGSVADSEHWVTDRAAKYMSGAAKYQAPGATPAPANAAPGAKPPVAPPARPAAVPPGAKFSPSQGKWWWQTAAGWQHS